MPSPAVFIASSFTPVVIRTKILTSVAADLEIAPSFASLRLFTLILQVCQELNAKEEEEMLNATGPNTNSSETQSDSDQTLQLFDGSSPSSSSSPKMWSLPPQILTLISSLFTFVSSNSLTPGASSIPGLHSLQLSQVAYLNLPTDEKAKMLKELVEMFPMFANLIPDSYFQSNIFPALV